MTTTVLPTNFRSETLADGKVVVFDVPIFAVCEKEGIDFTEAWIDQAVQYHRAGEENGHAWVMHIHHTNEEGRQILQAGTWTNTRKARIRTKSGKLVEGVIADLVFTNQEAADRAKNWELLWRSPEIPLTAALGKSEPRFKTLALLDRDAPHNDDLPVLTFQADAVRFRNTEPQPIPWARGDGEPVLAFGASTESIWALMEPTAMPDDDKKNEDDVKLQDGDKPASDGPPKEESNASAVDGLIEKIKAFKGTMEDIDKLKAALEELVGEDAPKAEPEEIEGGPADPTTPMKDSGEVLKLKDEVVRLKADLIAERKLREGRDADAAFDRAVADAFEKLKTKGVPREEIIAFADGEKGMARAAAVNKMAAELDKRLLDRTADFERHVEGVGQDVPDEVLKFRDEGPEAYEWALGQSRLYDAMREAGTTDMTRERFLKVRKPGGGFARVGT